MVNSPGVHSVAFGAQEEFKIREDSQVGFPAETSFVLGFFFSNWIGLHRDRLIIQQHLIKFSWHVLSPKDCGSELCFSKVLVVIPLPITWVVTLMSAEVT